MQAEEGLANHVVLKCLEGANIQGQGYHIYMDNFYTSPDLLCNLYNNKQTYACGTVRMNRRGLPKEIMNKCPDGIVNRGDMTFRQKGPLVAVVWKDKKIVSALSTIHDESSVEVQRLTKNADGTFGRQNVLCPSMISDYVSYMGGVDKADQYIQYYAYSQKTRKWPKKVFFRLMEIIKFNAFQLFLQSPHHQLVPNKPKMTFLQFSQIVVKGLIDGYMNTVRRGRPSLAPVEDRLTQRHLPCTFPSRSWCHVCHMRFKHGLHDKRSQTTYGCQDCRKHLCLPKCFSVYHSVNKYY